MIRASNIKKRLREPKIYYYELNLLLKLMHPNLAVDCIELAEYVNVTAFGFGEGLSQLADFFDNLASDLQVVNPLVDQLALVDKTLGEIIDFSSYFHDVLTRFTRTGVDSVTGELVSPFVSSGEFLQVLENLPGVDLASLGVTATPSDLRYTLKLDNTIQRTVPLALDIGDALRLDVSGSIDFEFDAVLDVTFGVSLDSGLFFVETSNTSSPHFSAQVSATLDADAQARLGFLAVGVTGGMATVSASAEILLIDSMTDDATEVSPLFGFDPPSSPGKITATELASFDTGSLSNTSFDGNASLTLPLTAALGTWTSPAGAMSVVWNDIRDPVQFILDTSQIQDIVNFNAITPDNLLDGLRELPSLLRGLAEGQAFGQNLPLIGSNASGLVRVADILEGFLDELAAFETAQDFALALAAAIGGGVQIDVNQGAVEFAFGLNQQIVGGAGDRVDFSIEEGVGVAPLRFGFQADGDFEVDGAIDVGLRFGISYADNVPLEERFYVAVGPDSDAELTFRADATINADAFLGFKEYSISGGTATIAGRTNDVIDPAKDASLRLELVDPGTSAADGKISLAEFLAGPQNVFGPLVIDGAIDVDLPFVPLPSTPVGDDPRLTLVWTDLADLESLTFTHTDLDSYLADASNFSIDSPLAGIEAVISMLDGLIDVDILNIPIPFINKPLRDVLDFAEEIVSFFEAVQSANPTDALALDSAMQNAIVAAGLNQLAGRSVLLTPNPNANSAEHDPSAGNFRYLLEYDYSFLSGSQEFDVGGGLFELNASLDADITFEAELEFGISREDGFFIVDKGPSAPAEIRLIAAFDAALDRIGGTFGPLEFGVLNGQAELVGFGIGIDLVDPNNSGGKISGSELAGSFSSVVRPGFGAGTAQLVMPMGIRIGGPEGPGVTTTFSASWDASSPNGLRFGPSNSRSPTDGFSPVKYELGEFVARIVNPLLVNIQNNNPLPDEIIEGAPHGNPLNRRHALRHSGAVWRDPEGGQVGLRYPTVGAEPPDRSTER